MGESVQNTVSRTEGEVRIYTTRDISETFGMGQRKVRAWLDYFYDYIQPSTNEKGHWILNESAYGRFQNVVNEMQKPGATMNGVRNLLLQKQLPSFSEGAAAEEPERPNVIPIRNDVTYQALKQTLDLVSMLEERVSHVEMYQKDMLQKYDEVLKRQIEENSEKITIREEIHALKESMTDLREKVTKNLKDMQFSLQMMEIAAKGSRRKKDRGLKIFG